MHATDHRQQAAPIASLQEQLAAEQRHTDSLRQQLAAAQVQLAALQLAAARQPGLYNSAAAVVAAAAGFCAWHALISAEIAPGNVRTI